MNTLDVRLKCSFVVKNCVNVFWGIGYKSFYLFLTTFIFSGAFVFSVVPSSHNQNVTGIL